MGAVVVDMFLVSCGFDRLTKFKASVGLYGIEQLFTHLFHTVKGGKLQQVGAGAGRGQAFHVASILDEERWIQILLK